MGKVGAFLAGFLTAVILGFVTYQVRKPTPVITSTAVAVPDQTVIQGAVLSDWNPTAIPGAMVVLELSGEGVDPGPYHDITDENGSYRFDFAEIPTFTQATITVSAPNFKGTKDSLPYPLLHNTLKDFLLKGVQPLYGSGLSHIPSSFRPIFKPKSPRDLIKVRR